MCCISREKKVIQKRASPFISIHHIWLRRERKIYFCGKYTRHLVFFRQNKYFAFALDIHYILFAVRKETHLNYHHGCWHWSYFSWRWWVNVKIIEIIKKSTEKYWICQVYIQWNIFFFLISTLKRVWRMSVCDSYFIFVMYLHTFWYIQSKFKYSVEKMHRYFVINY